MIKKLFRTQLRLNMASGVVTTLLRMAILLVSYPLYLSLLGYETYGIWVVLATVLSFSSLGELGIGEATTKFIAEAYGHNNIDEVGKYVVSSQVMLLASGLIVFAIVVVLREQIIDVFNLVGQTRQVALNVLPYIGALSIYVFIVHMSTATLSGLGRMDLANYIELLGRLVSLGLSIPLLWMHWGIMALILANAAAYFLIHIASMLAAWRIARVTPFSRGAISLTACKRLIGYGSGVLGITILSMLSDPLNKIIATRYIGLSSVVLYEIAARTGGQIKVLLNPALKALMPEISRLGGVETGHALTRVRKITRRAAKLVLLGVAPLYIVLFVLAKPLLELWLGQAFRDALPNAFRVVLTASYVSLLGGPAYYTLMGLGRVRSGLLAHILKATTNVAVVVLALFIWQPLTVSKVAFASLVASVAATLYLLANAYELIFRTAGRVPPVAVTVEIQDAARRPSPEPEI